MNLTVSEIADNTALSTSEQQTGTTFCAKVIEFYPVADIGFDYNIEVKLVKFVDSGKKKEKESVCARTAVLPPQTPPVPCGS